MNAIQVAASPIVMILADDCSPLTHTGWIEFLQQRKLVKKGAGTFLTKAAQFNKK